ncbi:MAG: hypothetical protein WD513_07345, partial [Balneolaceae bacterium]
MNKPKRKPFDGLKVLIIGKVWPESRSSAAGSRMMQLIDLLMRHHFEVHFASAASKSQHTDDLTPLGVVCHTIRLNDSSFDRFIRKLSPAVVIFDRFMTEEQFGWRVAEQLPDFHEREGFVSIGNFLHEPNRNAVRFLK